MIDAVNTGRVPGISWISTTIMLDPHIRWRLNDSSVPTGKTVFVFPDRGLRCRHDAVEMMHAAPLFADHIHCCDLVFAELVGWSLLDVLNSEVEPSGIDVAQPVLFAITVSLAKQWQALGMRPDAVLGDNLGEAAAAYVAGALSLPDAAKVVVLRSRALSAIEALDSSCAAAEHGDTWARTLREQLCGLRPRTAEVAFISTVTGAALDTSILDADYWSANLGHPTLFGHAVRWASEHGYRMFVESNPHPELTADILRSLGDHTVGA
ncbi:acyltransferase domain-containing protein [Mycolicibacterium sp. BiH015]|uniref:acyltransferase domain-containing protein n=1 Tax=Mycolicibacterium sp. BiH015 TaxID=3018808 RepID=UPI0022E29A4F|nr:acyltransferase domain-containing protein [Mycolicibacterium sp. BiH015]MDA2890257.1 acyltransferase domain-containing protein [Mycolicibacterium sp. BiH015]